MKLFHTYKSDIAENSVPLRIYMQSKKELVKHTES